MGKTGSCILVWGILLAGCRPEEKPFDASGTFEATETVISSEATGTIVQFDIREGQTLDPGLTVGYVDSTQLHLKRKQLMAQVRALESRRPDVATQLAVWQSQLAAAERERVRTGRLVDTEVAPQKQLDDINAQIDLLRRQISAQKSSLDLSSDGISKDVSALKIQKEQLDDQIARCRIVNPVAGTVLVKYAEPHEMTAAGKPLYRIAGLSRLTLRAYVSADQLGGLKLGQKVRVFTDQAGGGQKEGEGTLEWVSDKAEFTPKTIQTRDERANMVYAVKIGVVNDGTYKIGMYGEIRFQ